MSLEVGDPVQFTINGIVRTSYITAIDAEQRFYNLAQ
eukprot:gene3294-3800_t